jgi:AcrR family transcriptional regulator
MPRSGDQTRRRILDAAEQLYGAKGVANVSLRQIRIAARQRNQQAVQYHFGDRDGVIRALSERHMPCIEQLQRRLVDRPFARMTQHQLVGSLVEPWATYVTLGPSERAFVKIVSDLAADPTLDFATIQKNVPPEMDQAGAALFNRLNARHGPDIAVERVWTGTRFAIQAAAERARLVDDVDAVRPILPDASFIENLVNMAQGALFAPTRSPASPTRDSSPP